MRRWGRAKSGPRGLKKGSGENPSPFLDLPSLPHVSSEKRRGSYWEKRRATARIAGIVGIQVPSLKPPACFYLKVCFSTTNLNQREQNRVTALYPLWGTAMGYSHGWRRWRQNELQEGEGSSLRFSICLNLCHSLPEDWTIKKFSHREQEKCNHFKNSTDKWENRGGEGPVV